MKNKTASLPVQSPAVQAASLLRRFLQEITKYHRDLVVRSESLGPAWRILVQARARVLTDAKADTGQIMGPSGANWKTFCIIADLMGQRHGQTFMLEWIEPVTNPGEAVKSPWPWDERRLVLLTTDLFRAMAGPQVEVEAHGAGTSVVLDLRGLPESERLSRAIEGLKPMFVEIGYRHQRTLRLTVGQAVEAM